MNEKLKLAHGEFIAKAKAEGICVLCLNRQAEEGRTKCRICIDRMTKSTTKRRRLPGRCHSCGCLMPKMTDKAYIKDYKSCPKCRARRHNLYKRKFSYVQ